MTLTLASLFDGIGGFPLAFQRAGVQTVATVEIDSSAASIGARHFPQAAQFPDVTKVTADDLRATGLIPDRGVVTFGWPCQDFSVAGRRAGLAGARSGLWWEVVRILADLRPRWIIGENVPGLLSSVCTPQCPGGCMETHGGAMGAVLGSLGELGYGVAYRILDAQHFGVPQQRRRVFIVGHLGAPYGAAAQVLLEPESSDGHSAARGKTWPHVASTLMAGFNETGGTRPPGTQVDTVGTLVVDREIAPALVARYAKGTDSDASDALIVQPLALRGREGGAQLEIGPEGGPYNALRAGDGGSSRQSLIAITAPKVSSTLTAGTSGPGVSAPGRRQEDDHNLIAFHATQDPISSADHTPAMGTTEGSIAVAIDLRNAGRESGTGVGTQGDGIREGGPSYSLTATERAVPGVATETVVRRLTEPECERLQGYPDGWTDGQSGSARYRQLGNSVAVPVVEWLARRVVAMDREVAA